MAEEKNMELNDATPQEGSILRGKVVKIDEKEALIDIASKFEGVLPIGEISNLYVDNINDYIKLDDELELEILQVNDEKETITLSKKKIDGKKAWVELQGKLDSNETIDVKIVEVVKGGLVADVGVRGFIPASLVEKRFVEDFSEYKGKILSVKVIEVDQENNKVILSKKDVLEEEEGKRKEAVFNKITEGSIIEGTVKRLAKFGVFVDIGGIDGLVHVSELSWERVENPEDVVKEGDTVKVKVLKVEPEKSKISLSIKATLDDPWIKAIEEISIGKIYTGTVRRLADFGAFVEIAPSVDGLVHVSHISNEHISSPSEVLKNGQEVKVKVLDIKPESKRVSLSIREAEETEQLAELKGKYLDNNQGLNLTLGDLFADKLKDLK